MERPCQKISKYCGIVQLFLDVESMFITSPNGGSKSSLWAVRMRSQSICIPLWERLFHPIVIPYSCHDNTAIHLLFGKHGHEAIQIEPKAAAMHDTVIWHPRFCAMYSMVDVQLIWWGLNGSITVQFSSPTIYCTFKTSYLTHYPLETLDCHVKPTILEYVYSTLACSGKKKKNFSADCSRPWI